VNLAHIYAQELDVLSVIAKFKMQLKIKWVEINKPTHASPDVT
jgi:hypothetical protein